MFLELLLTLAVGALLYHFIFKKKKETLEMGDGWWGPGVRPDNEGDEEIHPFKIETTEEELKDLFDRIDHTRYSEPLEGSRFNYGFNSTPLRKVVAYWRNTFNWRKQLDILNKFPHFKTKIEGLDIHFIHVKPPHLPGGRTAIPIIMVHGWPGSFYEFYKIIPFLTDPGSHGLDTQYIFEVICPSIPGYSFSEASHKQGCESVAVARIFYKLMRRLGFREFYAQGGDWGSLICTNLAQIAPNQVKGLHINMAAAFPTKLPQILSVVLGQRFPGLFGLHDEDVRRIFPFFKKVVSHVIKESGYMHLQATKPDTAGCGLNNSPVGLAAYILEKFSTWTDPDFRDHEDGGLERKFSLDDLLTNIMIYWLSGSIVSSMRFYKEVVGKGFGTAKHDRVQVTVPTGVASFPNELVHCPPFWAKQKYVNIISFNYMPRGGHFAAFEEPELLAKDVQQFVGKVEQK
ncbi:epoxide hydrolase 1 precursor [Xenopus tropicalis]|uniref:Epoxide hydrolase n=1 Tax=Xenopus tropicalis TaxID=8364 RepID=B2GUB2_XENTR|nr:epoxide hydrolase 1 precursor [Xenopus tropicalis]AAI66207.1 LOC100158543 protein [Xenopus tropicalis]|eukprot:NP_001121449.1 epoxide hydrolase 1 precursor [Xenopus tropicalis]